MCCIIPSVVLWQTCFLHSIGLTRGREHPLPSTRSRPGTLRLQPPWSLQDMPPPWGMSSSGLGAASAQETVPWLQKQRQLLRKGSSGTLQWAEWQGYVNSPWDEPAVGSRHQCEGQVIETALYSFLYLQHLQSLHRGKIEWMGPGTVDGGAQGQVDGGTQGQVNGGA